MIKLTLNKSDLGTFTEMQSRDSVNYKLYMQGYHKFCNHHWRPEDIRRAALPKFKGANSGLLLWGERGCGKSQILTYCTAWAHEQKWFNITISNPEEFVGGKNSTFRYKNGLYLQQDFAKSMLEAIRHSNEELMREFDVDMAHYGKFDISGVKDGDPEPCPRKWDPRREKWSDDWKLNLFDSEVQTYQAKYETMNYRLGDRLADPKKLIEVCDYGIQNPDMATCAIAEVLEQLYKTDKYKTLVSVDNLNTWYQPSKFISFRYENDRKL